MDLFLVRGKILAHLKNFAGGFTLENLEFCESFRCCEAIADDGSNGVSYLRSKKFSYRRGDILIGTFDSAKECEDSFSYNQGFLSDEKCRELSNLLGELMKQRESQTNPPTGSHATIRRKKKVAALVRGPGAEIPPEGWTGRWLFTEKEAAAVLGGLKPQTLRNWRSNGAGGPKFLKIDGKVFYTFADLDAWGESAPFDPDTGFSPRPTNWKRIPK
jgi:hypothetical protein